MNKELQFLIYNSPVEDVKVKAIVKDESIWLIKRAMAELFDCSSDNISLHLKNLKIRKINLILEEEWIG